MRKTIVFVSVLAVFLMLMVSNVPAVEYYRVKETQESFVHTTLDTFRENIRNVKSNRQTLSVLASIMNIDIEEFKNTIKDIPSSLNVIKERKNFGDPGNGTDGNGPDDITDWMYGIIFWILIPVTGPLFIYDVILGSIQAMAVLIPLILFSFLFPFLLMLSIALIPLLIIMYLASPSEVEEWIAEFLEFMHNIETRYSEFLDKLLSLPFYEFPFILIGEFYDTWDYNGDGR